MSTDRESHVAELFLKSFEEKSPLDYDIIDSMISELNQEKSKISKN